MSERAVIISALKALALSSVIGFALILAVGGTKSPDAIVAIAISAGVFLVLWLIFLLLQWIRNPDAARSAGDTVLPKKAVNSWIAGRTQGDDAVRLTPPIGGGEGGCDGAD